MSRTAWCALLALVLSLLTGNAAAAVLGIDFGTDYYKISVISRKKTFDMVENLNSKTNTYNALSFFDGARVLEYEAFTKELKAPTSSFHLFSKLLGRDPQDKLVQEWRTTHRDQFKWVQEGNSTFVQIDTFQLPEGAAPRTHPNLKLRVEEIAGMVLQHARGLSDKYAGEEAKDVFFSVPPWWTPVERQVVISAAKLAGFNVLGMSSENTGTAVYHGVNRPKNAKNETILFLNVGTLSTKIGVYRFENVTDDKKRVRDTVRLLGEAWDETTGGLAFDVCIAEDFARSFDEKFKLDSVLTNPKVMRRLIREATKTREVLSANKETSMIVEEVFDNKDFIKKYTREDFEKACAPLFERIAKTVETTIKRAGIETKDLNEVELLGGASRMPGVHAIIKEKLGRTHSIHFNGDNSMAQGLAYMAANASNLINGKLVYLTNGPSYDITVQVEDPNTSGENQYKKTSTLFKKYHSYGSKKLVNLNYDKDVKVTLSVQSDESPYQLAKPYSISYQLSGVSAAFQKLNDPKFANKKFSLHFELSALGFPSLLKAEVVAEETTVNKDGKKSVSNHFEKIKVVLLEESHQGLFQFPELMKESASILAAFQEHDRKLHLLKAARNKLESIVYRMADLATDENIKKYSIETEVESLKAKAVEIDDWLFTPDARKATYEELNEKAEPFNQFQAVVEKRKTEHLKRPQALKEIHEKLDSFERTFRDMVDTRPWVPEADRKAAITKIHQIRAWVEDKSAEQAARPTKVDPILTLADLKEKESEASKEMTRIRAIPNPADKPKKKPEEPKETKEAPKGSETKIPIKPLLESLGLTADQIAQVNKKFPLDDPKTDLQQVLQYVREKNMSVKLSGGDKQQGEAQPDL